MRRTWEMFGGRGRQRPEFLTVADERTIRAYGREPVPVLVTEEEDGPYFGWIGKGRDKPALIQPRESLFRMQFPAGPQAEVDRGKGHIVRLRIEAAS